jgi:hypothetical protein
MTIVTGRPTGHKLSWQCHLCVRHRSLLPCNQVKLKSSLILNVHFWITTTELKITSFLTIWLSTQPDSILAYHKHSRFQLFPHPANSITSIISVLLNNDVKKYVYCTLAVWSRLFRLATYLMVRGSNPGGCEILLFRPEQPWRPPCLLYNRYRG